MNLSAVAVAAMLSIFNPVDENEVQKLAEPEIEWSCDEIEWLEDRIERAGYRARITVTCEFDAIGKGGYPQLNTYLIDRVQEEASEIHAGPVNKSYEGLNGIMFDLTTSYSGSIGSISVRQDVHLATDMETRYLFDTSSTNIRGSGLAGQLKNLAIHTDVRSTEEEHHYSVEFDASFFIRKSFLLSSKLIRSQVHKNIEKRKEKLERELIEELALNL